SDDADGPAAAGVGAAANGHGQLRPLPRQLFDLAFQSRPVGASRLVLPDRLVGGNGNLGDGVHDWSPGVRRLRLSGPSSHAAPVPPTAWAAEPGNAPTCCPTVVLKARRRWQTL